MRLYVTKEGESLYDVAKTYSVQFEILKAVNKHITDPSYIPGDTQITIPSVMGLPANVMEVKPNYSTNENKGNVCAFVDDTIVHYNKPNLSHWPSQDYTHPHPKNGTHAAEKFNDQSTQTYTPSLPSTPYVAPYTQHPYKPKQYQRNVERGARYYQKD
ncbi:LysM peptidoglycan-binding domain-containing protein [Halalkalibacter akibai]|uniref:LysM peptidoglycan-binding domain-containing protein n=1 Tax=Halalkalibacter akibai TaxID=1411 RepID=UPI0005571FA6|nr:LysM peptidoglycan-binding domain-containing protein [Halalkalibacter akibai]